VRALCAAFGHNFQLQPAGADPNRHPLLATPANVR
jgi:hypothetical protein